MSPHIHLRRFDTHKTPFPLGRHVGHDSRSRSFSVEIPQEFVPKTVIWPHRAPVLNQGRLNSCTGNAMTNLLNCVMFAPCRPGANHPWLTEAGAIKLYSQATRNDGFGSDQFYPPHDEGSTGLGVAKAAQNLGFIDSYEHCYTLRELQAALATQPVIVGTDWSMSMFKVDPITGFVTVGKLTDKTIAGGHEYMLQGIDYELKCVVGLNSWGPTWGGGHGLKGGQFRISFDDFADLLSDSGDIIVPKGRGLPAAA